MIRSTYENVARRRGVIRIMATKADKTKAMKATNAAQFAREIGVSDKALRAFLRRNKIRVSEVEFDAKAKNLAWGHFVEGKKVTKTDDSKSTRTSGGNSKNRRTRTRKETKETVDATAE
jgi:hypothetical protein